VPLLDRRAERRVLLIDAAFDLFGEGGEAAVSVRSLCRACGLNTRYFYESFSDVNETLGATYDRVALELGAAVEAVMLTAEDTQGGRTRAGMAAVLSFSSADPRRGRLLFTDAPANPVLAERRAATQALLFQLVVDEDARLHPDADPVSTRVGAALYTGAMTELAQQWLAGRLGDDVDLVVDLALRRIR
jgi:AcrR family transcriptional regulator